MSHKALVLLVEDEKGIRNFISTVLDVNNYRVVEARDGKEALELFTSRCPDLILLDLGLPDMDGIEVLKTIRGWSGIPIIVAQQGAMSVKRLRRLIWEQMTTSPNPLGLRSCWPVSVQLCAISR